VQSTYLPVASTQYLVDVGKFAVYNQSHLVWLLPNTTNQSLGPEIYRIVPLVTDPSPHGRVHYCSKLPGPVCTSIICHTSS
jgi:hypothetical protein